MHACMYVRMYVRMHACMYVCMYGSVQFKLDNYMRVALELFNKFVEPLAGYTCTHDAIS